MAHAPALGLQPRRLCSCGDRTRANGYRPLWGSTSGAVPHTPTKLQIEIVRALGRVGTATSLEYLFMPESAGISDGVAGNSDGPWGE